MSSCHGECGAVVVTRLHAWRLDAAGVPVLRFGLGFKSKDSYYTPLVNYVHSVKDRNVVLTGHSLGGGLAHIVGAFTGTLSREGRCVIATVADADCAVLAWLSHGAAQGGLPWHFPRLALFRLGGNCMLAHTSACTPGRLLISQCRSSLTWCAASGSTEAEGRPPPSLRRAFHNR